MPMMRLAKRRARSTSCMLMITGMFFAAATRARSSMISTEVFGSSDEVGSSASSNEGCCITAREMPTRWRCPPESESARALAKPVRPTISSVSQARWMSAASKLRQKAFHADVLPRHPVSRFSITVRRSTRLYSWNTMPMRLRAERNSLPESLTMSRPSNTISPAEGSTSRLMQRIRVDLPVPEGPMMAVMSLPSKVREMSRKTGLPGTYAFDRFLIRRDVLMASWAPVLWWRRLPGPARRAASLSRRHCG